MAVRLVVHETVNPQFPWINEALQAPRVTNGHFGGARVINVPEEFITHFGTNIVVDLLPFAVANFFEISNRRIAN
jgi:hypothetical protein